MWFSPGLFLGVIKSKSLESLNTKVQVGVVINCTVSFCSALNSKTKCIRTFFTCNWCSIVVPEYRKKFLAVHEIE